MTRVINLKVLLMQLALANFHQQNRKNENN